MDNLQPDFLYDHIQPVRPELFQVCNKIVFNNYPAKSRGISSDT